MGWIIIAVVVVLALGTWANRRMRDLEGLTKRQDDDGFHHMATMALFFRTPGRP